jgi:hypothetical protein
MTDIGANSVLPARREPITLVTSDGHKLVGELALPLEREPVATILCLHPNPTGEGMMDSHVFAKIAWRLPALADVAVLRWNTRGTSSLAGTSEGHFEQGIGEGKDLAAALAFALAVFESTIAKMRVFRVPEFLGAALLLGLLGALYLFVSTGLS